MPAFPPPQLLISHCQKSWSLDPWRLYLLGTTDEDRWPCGCFAARACKQVCSFVFHCHRQPLCGHRTAQKMEHVAFGKTLLWNDRPYARFRLKQNVSFQRPAVAVSPLVRARPEGGLLYWRTQKMSFIFGRASDLYLCLYNQLFALFTVFLIFNALKL